MCYVSQTLVHMTEARDNSQQGYLQLCCELILPMFVVGKPVRDYVGFSCISDFSIGVTSQMRVGSGRVNLLQTLQIILRNFKCFVLA